MSTRPRMAGASGAGVVSLRPRPAPAAATADIWTFAIHGMTFALPAAHVVDTMPVEPARWEKLARMAEGGTLGSSGLPLMRLATRLGIEPSAAPERGALMLFGTQGRVRATVLVDDVPARMKARVETMPSAWRAQFQPCEDLIDGVALLPDGRHAAMLKLSIGVDAPRLKPAARTERDSAHLLVRAGRSELEAVRVAALLGLHPIDEKRSDGRMLLLIGGDAEAVAVDEVVGLAPAGRIERIGGGRFLVTATRSYRLLEPGETSPAALPALRVLVTAPEGEARSQLRDLVHSIGHDVSLADDVRAARLVGGRFDIVLFDLDGYADVREAGIDAGTGARRVGFTRHGDLTVPPGFEAVVPAGDPVALIAALLAGRRSGA